MTDPQQPLEPEPRGSTFPPIAQFSVDVVVDDAPCSQSGTQLSVSIPAPDELSEWAVAALSADAAVAEKLAPAGIAIKLVSVTEMTQLNLAFAGKNRPTNVLSFPTEPIELIALPGTDIELELPSENFLGDIAICAAIVTTEAREQGKSTAAHWAHMIVHGVLHLCGYDHINDADARQMEMFEIQILNSLGFPDPYAVADHHTAGPNQPQE